MKFCTNHENFEIKVEETYLYDAWTKTHSTNLIKTPRITKNPKISLVQKIWWKCKNACNINKRRGKRVLPSMEVENYLSFDSEKNKKKKKKLTKRNPEESKEVDKVLKNMWSNSFLILNKKKFWLLGRNQARNLKCFKNKFDWSEGIEGGIESSREF